MAKKNTKRNAKRINRNLDGVYFRIQRNGKWQNICFSDLTEEEMDSVVDNKNRSFAVSLKDSALLKEKGINADGLYMMVRRDNKASEKNTKSHDSAIKFAKELVR